MAKAYKDVRAYYATHARLAAPVEEERRYRRAVAFSGRALKLAVLTIIAGLYGYGAMFLISMFGG